MGNITKSLTTEKAQNFGNDTQTITTLEIAEMMEVEHYEILKKLEGTTNPDGSVKQVGIIPTLGKGKIPVTDYFIKSTYITAQNKTMPCYEVTKLAVIFLQINLVVKRVLYSLPNMSNVLMIWKSENA